MADLEKIQGIAPSKWHMRWGRSQKRLEDKQSRQIASGYAAMPKISDTNSTCAWGSPDATARNLSFCDHVDRDCSLVMFFLVLNDLNPILAFVSRFIPLSSGEITLFKYLFIPNCVGLLPVR